MRKVYIILFIILWTCTVEAAVGVNFGAVNAVGPLSNSLNTGINANIFLETSEILFPLEIRIGITQQDKKEANKTKLLMFPITLCHIGYYPWLTKYNSFLKIGLGGVCEIVDSPGYDEVNLDPVAITTLGSKLKIDENFFIQPELSYMFIYQRYMDNAKYNGHFISFCIGIRYE